MFVKPLNRAIEQPISGSVATFSVLRATFSETISFSLLPFTSF